MAYESSKDKHLVKRFFERRSKSKKKMIDMIKRTEESIQKQGSIDATGSIEKKLIEPYLATNKRQITPKTKNKARVINFRHNNNLDSGSSINFERSMNYEDHQTQLPQMNQKTLSSGGVRNLRSYSSNNLGGGSNSRLAAAANLKSLPSTSKDHSPAPITQSEF